MNDFSDSQGSGGRLVTVPQTAPPVVGSYGYGYGGQYGTTGDSGLAAKIFEYWRIFKKRRWVILGVAAGCVLIGFLMTLMKTPLYTSTVRLQIDRQSTKVVQKGDVSEEAGYDPEFMKTQYELLMSYAISLRAASALKLGQDADFLKPRDFSIWGAVRSLLTSSDGKAVNANNEAGAAGIVVGNRAVKPVPGSRLVDLSYSDPNPARAQRIAMALADAFISANIDKRFQANSYAKVFLEDQAKQLKLRLEESEKTLLDFGQKEQIVATVAEKSNIAEDNLAAANSALGNLISDRIKNEGLWKQAVSAKGLNLPQFLTNAVIDGLRAKRKELETEYREKLELYKADKR